MLDPRLRDANLALLTQLNRLLEEAEKARLLRDQMYRMVSFDNVPDGITPGRRAPRQRREVPAHAS